MSDDFGAVFAIAAPYVARAGANAMILSLVDVWTLRRLSRACNVNMRKFYKERGEFPFFERLVSLLPPDNRDDVAEFLRRALTEWGCVVAGSAALWVVAAEGERWRPDDIDVVAPLDASDQTRLPVELGNALRDIMRQIGACSRPIGGVPAMGAPTFVTGTLHAWQHSDPPFYRAQRFAYSHPEWKGRCEQSIDFIVPHLECTTPSEHVDKTTDLSVCKTRLVWDEQLKRVVAHCPSKRDVEMRRVMIDYNNAFVDLLPKRCAKYRSRGFSFFNDNMLRYIERGVRAVHEDRDKRRRLDYAYGFSGGRSYY